MKHFSDSNKFLSALSMESPPLYRNRSEEDGKQKASSMSFQLAGEIAFIRLERSLWKLPSIVFGLN